MRPRFHNEAVVTCVSENGAEDSGSRRKNERGQTVRDRERLIRLQQVLRRPVHNVPVPLRDADLK